MLIVLGSVSAFSPAGFAQGASLVPLADFDAAYGVGTVGELTADAKGNFYGVAYGANAHGVVFRLTNQGERSILYEFDGTLNSVPPFPLTFGRDGNLYGATGIVTGNVPYSGKNVASIFRLTPAGVLTLLYTFPEGSGPTGPLVRSADGASFYGTAQSGAGFMLAGTRRIFQVSEAGELTTLSNYPATTLTLGEDGNLYCTGAEPAPVGSPATESLARVTPTGEVTTLAVLVPASGRGGVAFTSRLVEGADHAFYGTTLFGGEHGVGSLYRVTKAGELTTVVSFDPTGNFSPYGLVLSPDGYFYGAASVPGHYPDSAVASASLFRASPAGEVTTLALMDPHENVSGLTVDSDGGIVGSRYLYGESGYGSEVFRVKPHPTFFTGENLMSDGLFYLDLGSGTPFGFYRYSADPRYLLHFDLGWEYVMDAADAQHGLYLYDFKLGGFLYTSPGLFPYLYDFNANAFLYYFPDPARPGHYSASPRVFYNFRNGQFIYSP